MKPPEDMTDTELSEVVALEVAGWVKNSSTLGLSFHPWITDSGEIAPGDFRPHFATSAGAVMPLLEGHYVWECQGGKIGGFYVGISSCKEIYEKLPEGVHEIEATGLTFARAACIALLKAKRASQ